MADRLTRITTRNGDGGETRLADGSLWAKDDARIESMGTVDELNSVLGMVLAAKPCEAVIATLTPVQHDLFEVGSELAVPGGEYLSEAALERLDEQIASLNAELPPLREFILPGGSPTAATLHLARTVCRRTERCLVSMLRAEQCRPLNVQYLNRLSDLLFILSRLQNRADGIDDVFWAKA